MRKLLKPEQVTAIVDTREQTPFDLSPLKMERGTLTTGDYSVKGLEHIIAVERKSLQDLVMCCGAERERFEACCQRMLSFPVRAIVVEATWHDLEMGAWRGKTTSAAVVGSVLGWIAMGIPVILGHNAGVASRLVTRMLFIAARRRYNELVNFAEVMSEPELRRDEAPDPKRKREPRRTIEQAIPRVEGAGGADGTPT